MDFWKKSMNYVFLNIRFNTIKNDKKNKKIVSNTLSYFP